ATPPTGSTDGPVGRSAPEAALVRISEEFQFGGGVCAVSQSPLGTVGRHGQRSSAWRRTRPCCRPTARLPVLRAGPALARITDRGHRERCPCRQRGGIARPRG